MITVACLTSLVALNGKNHAGTRNSAAFTVTQPLERAQNDAFGHPTNLTHIAFCVLRFVFRPAHFDPHCVLRIAYCILPSPF